MSLHIADVDLQKNQLKNAVIQTSQPSNPKEGMIYYNTTDKNLYRYNGTSWVTYQAPISTVNASTISIDSSPTEDSNNLVTSGGVYTALQNVDGLPSQSGNNGKFLTTNGTAASWGSLPTAAANTAGVIKVGTNLSISDGVLSATDTTYTFDGTYNASSNKAATVSTVTNAINALDGGTIGTGSTTKTITALSQTNGNVSATFSNIAFPVTSVNTKTGAVSLTASDVGALPDNTPIPSTPADIGAQPSIGTVSGILKADGSGNISAAVGGTDYARMSDIPTVNYPVTSVNTKTGAVTLGASDVGAVATTAVGAASGVAPLNASSKIDATYLPSYVDDVIEGYYKSADGKFYENYDSSTQTFSDEITGESGKIYVDLLTNKTYRYSGSAFVEVSQGSIVTVSQGLSSGATVGTITVDGTTTTLYAPEDTDTKVTQTKATYSSYTYWRAVPVGALSASGATTAFGTTATTDREYSFDNLRFWPQYGWLRTHAFNPAPTSANTTASFNNMTSDSINNIYFRVNATAYNNGDTVLTLYSNGEDMQVRPGGQYDNMIDLGKSTVRWKNLYLAGNAYVDGSISGTLAHKITFGDSANPTYTFDGSADVNIPMYNGETS